MSDTELMLLILIIIIVVIVALVAIMMRSKKGKEAAASPQVTDSQAIQVTIQKPSDAKIVTPVTVTPSVTTPPLTPVPTPSVAGKAPLTTVPKTQLLTAGPDSFDVEAPKEKKEGVDVEGWDLKESRGKESSLLEKTKEKDKTEPTDVGVKANKDLDDLFGGI